MPPVTIQPNQPRPISPERSKLLVDEGLEQEFQLMSKTAGELHPSYERLIDVAQSVALAGGKRLRPYMTMLTYEAYSGKPGETILPAAVALELLHIAMLLLDDVIDEDTVRHDAKNVTGQYLDIYENNVPDIAARRKHAESMGILAGSKLLVRAVRLFDHLDLSPGVRQEIDRIFEAAVDAVTSGQVQDVEATFLPESEINPRLVAEHKTASYSFVAPLLIGAVAAGAPKEEIDKLHTIATRVGIAYQLADDYIGVFGDPKQSGKSASGDIREGKHTLITQTFYTTASEDEKNEYASIAGNHEATEDQIARARYLLDKYARRPIEKELKKARTDIMKALGQLAVSGEYLTAFKDLIGRSLVRVA